MHNPKTISLFHYWQGLRQGRLIPGRHDVEPRQIKALLPNLFILEMLDSKHFVFRLAGTSLCNRYGREFRSHNFLSLWRGDDHLTVRNLLNESLTHSMPAYTLFRGASIDQVVADYETLIAPMTDEHGQANRLIGTIQPIESQDPLRSRKVVRQWVLDHQLISSAANADFTNGGAPRPIRVDKADLRLVVTNPHI